MSEWLPQVEVFTVSPRLDGHHDVIVSAHTKSAIRIGAKAVIGDGTYRIVDHMAVVAQTGETYDDAGHALALAQDLIRRTTGYSLAGAFP